MELLFHSYLHSSFLPSFLPFFFPFVAFAFPLSKRCIVLDDEATQIAQVNITLPF